MSRELDEKVVEMRFDNTNFEKNIQTTMSTLEKFKKALNFKDSENAFDELEYSTNRIDFSGLSNSLHDVISSFTLGDTVAAAFIKTCIDGFQGIISSAGSLVKSLSIDQVTAGWGKYADKTSAVQTIMSATRKQFTDTGEQMEYVNEQLDKLNWYTDETSFNFIDMVNNIGKFTSNGIKLDSAVTSMQGISNWAAASGANIEQAGRAMYNLSQALSMGAVRVQDWMSVENATMATEEFKQVVIDTALEMGTLKKNSEGFAETTKGNIVDVSTFRANLADLWFTSDVLVKSLEKYGGFTDILYEATEATGYTATEMLQRIDEFKAGEMDLNEVMNETGMTAEELTTIFKELADESNDLGIQSFKMAQEAKTFQEAIDATKDAVSTGWMTTFDIIFGDYEEAKELWTDLANAMYDVFAAGGEARNELLGEWSELGGRDTLIESFWSAWDGAVDILDRIKKAFHDVFGEIDSKKLIDITNNIKKFVENIRLSDESLDSLEKALKGVFSLVDIGYQGISALLKVLSPLLSYVKDTGKYILTTAGNLGEWLSSIDELVKKSNIFEKSLKDIVNFVKDNFVFPAIEVLDGLLERIGIRTKDVSDSFKDFKKSIGEGFTSFNDWLSNIGVLDVLASIKNVAGDAISKTIELIGKAFKFLAEQLKDINFGDVADLINSFAVLGLSGGITNFVKGIKSAIEPITNLKDKITGVFDGVKDSLKSFQESLKAETLLKIAEAVGILSASLVALALIDSDKLNSSLGAITVMLTELIGSLYAFEKITSTNIGGFKDGISEIFGMKKLKSSMDSLISLAGSILILSFALKQIGEMDTTSTGNALSAMTVVMIEMLAFLAIMKKIDAINDTQTKLGQLIVLGGALYIFAISLKELGSLEADKYAQGLGGITVIMIEMLGFLAIMKTVNGINDTKTKLGELIILGASLLLFVQAVKQLADIDPSRFDQGMIGVTGLLVGMAGVITILKAVDKISGSNSKMLELIVLGASLLLFVQSVKQLSDIDPSRFDQGMIGVTGLLVGMAGVITILKAVDKISGSNSKMLELIVLGASLLLFVDSVKRLSELETDKLKQGIIGVGAVLAEILIFVALLNKAEATMSSAKILAMSASILVISEAINILSKALVELGKLSLTQLAIALTAVAGSFTIIGIAAVVLQPLTTTILALGASLALIGVGMAAFGVGVAATGAGILAIAVGLKAAVEAVISSIEVILEAAPQIVEFLKLLIINGLELFKESVPLLVETIVVIIDEALKSLVNHVPSMVDSIFNIVIKVLEVLAERVPEMVTKLVDVVSKVLAGLVEVLSGLDGTVIAEGIVGVGIIAALIYALSAIGPLIPGAMVGVLGITAVVAELIAAVAAIGLLAQLPGLNWLINEGGTLLESLGHAIGSFIGGIIGGITEAFSNSLPNIGTNLSSFMTNLGHFIEGAKKIDSKVFDGIGILAKSIIAITAAEVISGIGSFLTGGNSFEKFGKELKAFATPLKEFAKEIDDLPANSVINAANAAGAVAEFAKNIPNEGGLLGKLMGENSLSKFSAELALFGPSLMVYAKSVEGLPVDAVTNSAMAAESISAFAKGLPNSGGVVGWFTGENSLSVFSAELALFGPSLMMYAKSVKGMDADVVTNSISAANVLSSFANNLPNQGGVVSWFTGDNTLSSFGEELAEFGPYLAEYYDKIKEIKPTIVTNTANAVKALAELCYILPETGLLSDKNDTLSHFGVELKDFGKRFKEYYEGISGINVSTLGKVLDEINHLIEICVGISKVNLSDMKGFGDDLEVLGASGIKGFTKAFENSEDKVIKACKKLVDYCTKSLSGMAHEFSNIGKYFVEGFADGITKETYLAEARSREMASRAAEAARKELDEHSPSKVGYRIGHFFGLGFVNAIADSAKESEIAGKGLAQSAKDGLNKAVEMIESIPDFDLNYEVTITPVLDLSEIQNGKNLINSFINTGISYSGKLAYSVDQGVNAKAESKYSVEATITKDDLKEFAKELEGNIGTTFNNEFNIQSDDPKGVANEVSSVIQHQIERRREVWA